MTVAIKVPAVGESITEGTIARWLKKDGEFVRAEEPVFELETDKATTAVPAPASGTLHVAVREGETVQIGAVVGQIDPDGKPAADGENSKRPAAVREPAPAAREPVRAAAQAPAAA